MSSNAALKDQSIEELENQRQWWWAAEKRRSKRLDYLRKAMWKKGAVGGLYNPGVKVDLEKGQLAMEPWTANQAFPEPEPIRFAKELAHYLDNKTIFITDKAQLVGYVGSLPHTIFWDPAMGEMLNEEVYNDATVIPDPVDDNLKEVAKLCDFWAGKTMQSRIIPQFDLEDMMKIMSGAVGWGLPTSRSGYSGKDYEYLMRGERGFADIVDDINVRYLEVYNQSHSGTPKKNASELVDQLNYWEAMRIVLEAAIRHAGRYARLARILAENYESDATRKDELLKIAETCDRVPAHAPRTLQESLQYDLFIQLFSRTEAVEGAWPARPDYYHWAMYNKDVNVEKNITRDEAIDLVGEFLIRAAEVGQYKPRWTKEGLQGIDGTWVWTLGGVNPDGTDACNDLTVALLQAARLVRVANPTFAFRWHPKVKDEVMREVFECIRHGLGYPSIRNDPLLIQNSMHWHKHPLKEARTWVHQACMSPCPTTKHGFQPMRMASATANCAKIVEYVFTAGFDRVISMQMGEKTQDPRTFKDFEEVMAAWEAQMKCIFGLLVRAVNRGRTVAPEITPRPYLSAVSERSVETGKDVCDPSLSRGNAWITGFTWVENPDSLAAVKKLVFDEKKYTMDQLVTALEANWEGFEEMRIDFVKNAPKWGNDDDYVDDIMVRCLRMVADYSMEMECPSGNSWPLLPENVSGNIHYANMVGALPNGRRLGDALYDGGISPGPGLDKKGPTAVLKSCGKIDHVADGRAFLLNQRLSPSQLSGEKGYQLWKAYIRTWADLGLDHVQFNMVSDETLKAAQRDPEKYQEVIVRVAGYSAHFVDISRKTQDNIIQRTIQGI
ncbi:MAG: formate acetyltransferase [Deltaproteobacteria bacterium]|nr:formate acetyltransferase [Deltaproteobacteria bacterium]